MHVIFVAPHFPANQRQFVRALKEVGAKVTGIGEAHVNDLDGQLKGWLDGWEQVRSVCDENALYEAVRRVQKRGWVDRLEAMVEAHILPTARVREACTIPGMTVEQALVCRDKPLMKEVLRRHGIPCARSVGSSDPATIIGFGREVGYPLIVKPRTGAGASGTYRVDNEHELYQVLSHVGVGRNASVAVEEFITGHEGFYDTLTVGGEVVFDFASHYYPNVLEAMRTRWISPQICITNRIDQAPAYQELRHLGRRVIKALGLHTCATHMEWFAGSKGLRFSEIGARPPGVNTWDLYCAANDIDLYKEWAMALVHGRTSSRLSRNYSTGIIALRPDRDGRIAGYKGVDEVQRAFGKWILDAHLPPPGTPTQPVEAGYMANAWVRMRHPDYDVLREMMNKVGQTLKVYAH